LLQIAESSPFRIEVFDVSGLPHAAQELEIEIRGREECERVFDLASGPLLCASALKLGPREHVLFLNWHHIASDGWSIGVFVRELAAFYEARCGGAPARLPELPAQYSDFALWQRQWLSGDVLKRYLDYWTKQLGGAPPLLNLPTDKPRPRLETWRGGRRRFTLTPELHSRLHAVSREANGTLLSQCWQGSRRCSRATAGRPTS